MIARVRQYRSAEEAVREWTRLGLELPERALGLLPGTPALFIEGRMEEVRPAYNEAVACGLMAGLSERGHRPRLCVVAGDDELVSLDAVLGDEMVSTTIGRYRSDGAPPVPLPRGELRFDRTLVMGILNITPDSFSDGGRFMSPEDAAEAALGMAEAGADIIDVGGESTRPGAAPVPLEEELRRILPVVQRIARQIDVPISIDTRKPEVAAEAVEAGASIINDVSGLESEGMALAAATLHVPVVLMHALADPLTMQLEVSETTYDDVISDIMWTWESRMASAARAGLAREHIILDPGIGFGKLLQHNLEILDRTRELRCAGRPVLIGASRKKFIGRITGEEPAKRLGGSLAAAAVAALNGASVVRVHDVRETVSLIRTLEAVRSLRT